MRRLIGVIIGVLILMLIVGGVVAGVWGALVAFPLLPGLIGAGVTFLITKAWEWWTKKQEGLHDKKEAAYSALVGPCRRLIIAAMKSTEPQDLQPLALEMIKAGDDHAFDALLYASSDVIDSYGQLRQAVLSSKFDEIPSSATTLLNAIRTDLGAGATIKLPAIQALFAQAESTTLPNPIQLDAVPTAVREPEEGSTVTQSRKNRRDPSSRSRLSTSQDVPQGSDPSPRPVSSDADHRSEAA